MTPAQQADLQFISAEISRLSREILSLRGACADRRVFVGLVLARDELIHRLMASEGGPAD
ncbi:hypothetical protein SFA35_10065 [Pseudomonas sp. HR96]|uniref:hypothetical protein n=1 Tax=Pseudomonas sp. HR96 TaxID=1027966 RepID=UPI002A76474F|nr:hypothetical protein [Pseudomonas sp. HR96]WPP01660.1 hypothetical protein SFA35_10065 [Pseudomonas sp. HR96]